MGDTAHTGNTQVHSFLDTLRTKFRDVVESAKLSVSTEQRFTSNQVIYLILVFLCISLLVFIIPPLSSNPPGEHVDFLGFWTTHTGSCSDAPGLLISLCGALIALIALIIFRTVHTNAHTRHDYNSQHQKDAIQNGIIIVIILSQALLTMEMPQMITIMGILPGWTLALVFFLVNIMAILSISDYAAWVKNAQYDAEHKISQYQKWKNEHSKQAPASEHPWVKATSLPFGIDCFYFMLTLAPLAHMSMPQASAPWMQAYTIGMLVIVSVVLALLISPFTVLLLFLSFKVASSEEKDWTPAAALIAAAILFVPLIINVSIAFFSQGTPTLRAATQIPAAIVATANVILLLHAQPRCLTIPYLMMVCDKAIRKQERIRAGATSILNDLNESSSGGAADAAAQTAAAAGHWEETTEDTGNGYDTITGEGTPRSRLDAWRIGFGLQAAAGLEPSDYAVTQAQNQIDGDVSYAEVEQNLRDYHAAHRDEERHFEADIVATRISSLLQDPSFVFSPAMLDYVHERLFQGVLPDRQAGVRHSADCSEREPLPGGGPVPFVPHQLVDETLRRVFNQERLRRGSYAGMTRRDIADSVTGFISGLWQVRPFSKGNTRAVMVLAIMYLRLLGFTVNPEPFRSHGAYLHDALVLDNVLDPDVRDPAPLRRFMEAVLFDPGIDLPPVGTRDDGTGHAL